jgi:hypothetical protein
MRWPRSSLRRAVDCRPRPSLLDSDRIAPTGGADGTPRVISRRLEASKECNRPALKAAPEPRLPVAYAVGFIGALLASPGMQLAPLGQEWPTVRQLCLDIQRGGNEQPDAWLSAAVVHTGGHLVSFDRDFRKLLAHGQFTLLAATQRSADTAVRQRHTPRSARDLAASAAVSVAASNTPAVSGALAVRPCAPLKATWSAGQEHGDAGGSGHTLSRDRRGAQVHFDLARGRTDGQPAQDRGPDFSIATSVATNIR